LHGSEVRVDLGKLEIAQMPVGGHREGRRADPGPKAPVLRTSPLVLRIHRALGVLAELEGRTVSLLERGQSSSRVSTSRFGGFVISRYSAVFRWTTRSMRERESGHVRLPLASELRQRTAEQLGEDPHPRGILVAPSAESLKVAHQHALLLEPVEE